MGMTIKFSIITEKRRARYTVYITQQNKQGGDKVYGRGGEARGTWKRDTQNISDDTQKYQ